MFRKSSFFMKKRSQNKPKILLLLFHKMNKNQMTEL